MTELPRITKRELARVGIKLVLEDDARSWMRRGWLELGVYLWNQERFRQYERLREVKRGRMGMGDPRRVFEEDGA